MFAQDCVTKNLPLVSAENVDLFRSPEEIAKGDAWHRALIPLTRSIYTLVITLSDTSSEFSGMMLRAAKRLPDIVELL